MVCIICGERVLVKQSTSTPRDTCPRVKDENGIMVKSECEKTRDRRFQKKYRDGKREEKKKAEDHIYTQNSFADTDGDHIVINNDKKKKKVLCLKCRRKFTAVGDYNRICKKCTNENNSTKSLRY